MRNHRYLNPLLIIGGFSVFILLAYYFIVVVFRIQSTLPLNATIHVPITPERVNSRIFLFGAWATTFLALLFVKLSFVHLETSPNSKTQVRYLIEILSKPRIRAVGLILLLSGAAALAIKTGFRHDYVTFVLHWSAILKGANPWDLGEDVYVNAYGPLYNALAVVFAIHPLAPKLLFCLVWLSASAYLIKVLSCQYRKDPLVMLAGLIFVFLNPFFWFTIAEYGLFDILPATFCLSSVALAKRQRFYWAGLMLGIGTLFKYYPIVLLPFLMIQGQRLQIRLALSCIATITTGLLISVAIWGPSTFSPLLFASERESKLLSIFMFLRGEASPLRLLTGQPNVDAYSTYAMAFFWALVFLLAWMKGLETGLAATAGMLTALTFYKVGHSQFYTLVFLMVPFWYATSGLSEIRKLKILFPLSLLLAWLIAFQLIYNLFGGLREWPWVDLRNVVGLPTFGLQCWSVVAALRYGGRS